MTQVKWYFTYRKENCMQPQYYWLVSTGKNLKFFDTIHPIGIKKKVNK
jgi:hypothetical protein